MTPSPPIVTLLSDFGYSEPFVGIMKGVILRTVPQAQLVDLSHDIPAQDISVAGFGWRKRSLGFRTRLFTWRWSILAWEHRDAPWSSGVSSNGL